MTALLQDLLGHQFWADAELWKVIRSHEPAQTDTAILDRVHHIHQVQRFFMWAIGDRSAQPRPTTRQDYPTLEALEDYARQSHDAVSRELETMTDARLAAPVTMPWFKDPPLTISVAEALTQCAMHSHHHRGQNATRLRELGAVPPTLDLIVWYWKGRPSASW